MWETPSFDYSPEKNTYLKETRGISFEEVVLAIDEGRVLDIIETPNQQKHPRQKMYVVNINGYVYLVPFVRDGDVAFLKTVFPSRKFTKLYLNKDIK